MKSGGSMITLKLNFNKEDTFKFCKSLKYFSLAESLGGVESLICHPATMTHASVDDKTKTLLGIDDALVRLSIGCEDTNDLISDILFALNQFWKLRYLLKNPIWKNLELGYAIPDSIHAVSVALPTWNDVIKYEEKDLECMNLLKSIYPRFGLNPIVKRLCEKVKKQNNYNNKSIWPYPNESIAFKAKKYIDRNTSEQFSLIEKKDNLAFLITEKEESIYAKSFWQHTGLGISSRAAAIELGLEDCPPKSYVNECSQKIKNRISKSTKINSNDIHLTSSGMSALHTSLEIIYKLFPAKPTLQVGFPYVDVLKLPMKIFHGAKLITEENCADIE